MEVLGCPWRSRDPQTSSAVGAALIVIGLCSAAANGWLVLRLQLARPRAPTRLLLLQLSATALCCTLLAGFPFTGSSAISGRWLFSPRCCVWLAVVRQVSESAQMWSLCALGLERRRESAASARAVPSGLPGRWYAHAILLSWTLGLAVATPPLWGWGSVGCDVSGVWCAIKWGGRVAHSTAYVLYAILLGRVLPATLTVWFLCGAVRVPGPGGGSAVVGACSTAGHGGQKTHTGAGCAAMLRMQAALTATALLIGAGLLLLRLPRLLLDAYLAAAALPWSEAPSSLSVIASISDEASALVVPLVCAVVDRRLRPRWSACFSWSQSPSPLTEAD